MGDWGSNKTTASTQQTSVSNNVGIQGGARGGNIISWATPTSTVGNRNTVVSGSAVTTGRIGRGATVNVATSDPQVTIAAISSTNATALAALEANQTLSEEFGAGLLMLAHDSLNAATGIASLAAPQSDAAQNEIMANSPGATGQATTISSNVIVVVVIGLILFFLLRK